MCEARHEGYWWFAIYLSRSSQVSPASCCAFCQVNFMVVCWLICVFVHIYMGNTKLISGGMDVGLLTETS